MKRNNRIKKCQQMVYKTRTEEETLQLGKEMAAGLKGGDVVLLHGGLGAGKSVFTRGIARGLGISGPVTSPTFTILNVHEGPGLKLHHFDLYRIEDPDELDEIGFDEFITDSGAVSVIEWPEVAKGLLPKDAIEIRISSEDGGRKIVIGRNQGRKDSE